MNLIVYPAGSLVYNALRFGSLKPIVSWNDLEQVLLTLALCLA